MKIGVFYNEIIGHLLFDKMTASFGNRKLVNENHSFCIKVIIGVFYNDFIGHLLFDDMSAILAIEN